MTLAYDELVPAAPPAEPANDVAQQDVPEPYELGEHFWLQFPFYSKRFAEAVMDRWADHQEWWQSSAYGRVVMAAHRAYHNMNPGAGGPEIDVQEAGESGELLSMKINNYRSLLKHQIALTASEPPAWQPQARTSEAAAAEQVPMVTKLLDCALTMGLRGKLREQLEMAKSLASSFLVLGWDSNAGLNKSGWFTSRVVTPWEMAHERVRDYEDAHWWIWRGYESRWDWVARNAKTDPDLARKIAGLDQEGEEFAASFLEDGGEDLLGVTAKEGDQLACLYLLARPSSSCEQGRYAVVTSEGIVLQDGESPWGDDVPITRICPAQFLGTALPFSDSWMLLAPAECLNAVMSMLMSRIDAFGVPSIAAPKGTDLTEADFSGNKLIEFPPGLGNEVKPIDLMGDFSALPGVWQILSQTLSELSGVNSVTRGQPSENVTSGSMAALLQSMAIQYNSTDEEAWVANFERVGTLLVKIFQKMATKPVLVSICGEDQQWTIKEFQGEQIDGVMRVTVKSVNALAKAPASRLEQAGLLLQQNMFERPGQYLKAVQTGQIDSEISGPVRQENMARAENERIRRGEQVFVLTYDNDLIHMRVHEQEFNNPQVRYDPAAAKAMVAHMNGHMENWTEKSREAPDICAAQGMPPLPQAKAIGEQGRAIEALSMGVPPAQEAPAPPPRQLKQDGTEPPGKSQPGPAPAPKGQEPSSAAPSQPKPAKAPDGQRVA